MKLTLLPNQITPDKEELKKELMEAFKSIEFVSLFEQIELFFQHLFVVAPDDPKPLSERCYIIITRKGFSLWLAGMLCGLVGDVRLDNTKLISDRNWKKMTVLERKDFISDKHVYIVDDSILTGSSIHTIYYDINVKKHEDDIREGLAKSRNIAFLAFEHGYDYESMFENYYRGAFGVEREQKDVLNELILKTIYDAAIPYTADSPSYRIIVSSVDVLKDPRNGWEYVDGTLNFGTAGQSKNTFFLKAPADDRYGANFVMRGMRICYKQLGDGNISLSLVPWTLFDAIDYDEAVIYLLKLILADGCFDDPRNTFLYKQLTEGETKRKHLIVYRVISYLYNICLTHEFERSFLPEGRQLDPFTINGIELEAYHYSDKLYQEIKTIAAKICRNCNQQNAEICPANCDSLRMSEEAHSELASALCKMTYKKLDIPRKVETADKIGLRLNSRCNETDNETSVKLIPLICYVDDTSKEINRSVIILDYLRRSIASLSHAVVSYKGGNYLLNTLHSGEGSPLVFIDNYDFIYALHAILSKQDYEEYREYNLYENLYENWVNYVEENKHLEKEEEPLQNIIEPMVHLLYERTPVRWPSPEAIQITYEAQEKLLPLQQINEVIGLSCGE